jgi:transcriptional regulator GlxA family with amidase domain
MHGDVAKNWTIAELARQAGMSRASFATRFMRAVGVPPMQYLLQWRMTLAKDLLRRKPAQLGLVAAEVGYQSASAFSTAFSRHLGIPPACLPVRPAEGDPRLNARISRRGYLLFQRSRGA